MIKNKKAQVMLLDVLFAIVLIILIFFLLFKVSETKMYAINSSKQINELESVGNLAFNKLTNNTLINCKVIDQKNNFLLKNCFYADSNINKQNLGLGSEYFCNFEIPGFNLNNNLCSDDYSDSNNFFAISFQVNTFGSKEILKSEYLANILNKETTIDLKNAKLVVWK